MGRRLAGIVGLALLTTLSCGRRSSTSEPIPAAPTTTSESAAPPTTKVASSYRYTFTPSASFDEMKVDVCFSGAVPAHLGEPMENARAYLRGARHHDRALAIDETGINLEGVATGDCVAYRIDTGALLNSNNTWDGNGRIGDDVLLSPDYWLYPPAPRETGAPAVARFASERWQPAIAWPRDSSVAGYSHRIPNSTFLWKTQAAFGQLEHKPLKVGQASLDVVTVGDGFGDREPAVERWLKTSTAAVVGLLGRFPVERTMLLMVAEPERKGSFGFTVRGGGATATILLPASASQAGLDSDWTAVHELLHFALPPLPKADAWLYEGVVTYLTAVARARAGIISDHAAWWELLDGFERGSKVGGDVTLRQETVVMHENRSYWRVYWAGAAMALLMDVELHRRDKTLAETVAAVDADPSKKSTGADVIARLDSHCDSDIPSSTVRAYLDNKAFPDTAALIEALGVKLNGKTVSYDDAAPDAAIRRRIMARAAATGD